METLLPPSEPPSWYRVPREIQDLLLAAVATWDDAPRSDCFMHRVLSHPELTLEVLVSAYRYFFYRSNNGMARRLALQVMERIRDEEALPQDWQDLQPVLMQRLNDPPIRLYLSAYTALGMMLARWGALQAAIEISTRMRTLDPKDRFGAGAILRILTQAEEEDDYLE